KGTAVRGRPDRVQRGLRSRDQPPARTRHWGRRPEGLSWRAAGHSICRWMHRCFGAVVSRSSHCTMRGGVLPAALLFAALGLALASSSRRTWAWSLAALAGTLLALSQVELFREWLEI